MTSEDSAFLYLRFPQCSNINPYLNRETVLNRQQAYIMTFSEAKSIIPIVLTKKNIITITYNL